MIEAPKSWESIWVLDKIKQNLNDLKKNITDNITRPKENSEEYKRVENLLWEDMEDYQKYWTIKKVNTSINMIKKWIIKKEDISKEWTYMNKWDNKWIEIAQKLTELWVEIKPYDSMYIMQRNNQKIENLKKFKAENNNSLEKESNNPVFWNNFSIKVNASDYESFK